MRDGVMGFYDSLETRSVDARQADLAQRLPEQVARAQAAPGYADLLSGVDAATITSVDDLASLPVLRKSELSRAQAAHPPFGGFTSKPALGFAHIFQSPGPIYEPGDVSLDWWRMGRFLHAVGIGAGDVVHALPHQFGHEQAASELAQHRVEIVVGPGQA